MSASNRWLTVPCILLLAIASSACGLWSTQSPPAPFSESPVDPATLQSDTPKESSPAPTIDSERLDQDGSIAQKDHGALEISPSLKPDDEETRRPLPMTLPGIRPIPRVIDPVYFETDRSELNATARRKLDLEIKWFQEHPDTLIVLEGHCGLDQLRGYGFALSMTRALSVEEYLSAHGLAPERIFSLGYGALKPRIVTNQHLATANDRVELAGYYLPDHLPIPERIRTRALEVPPSFEPGPPPLTFDLDAQPEPVDQ